MIEENVEMLRPDPEESAKEAGLRYVHDDMPGIHRKRWGRGFTYIDPEGNHITETEKREELESLAIPPAWTDVWICPYPNGHILATGRDEKGRKQYIYHPRWREKRDETKYHRVAIFARALPELRCKVEKDLEKPGLPREKVLATVVRLLDTTAIRVGNWEYAKKNRSFGLTTMRDRHVKIAGSHVHFQFEGKSGVLQEVDFEDERLAQIVKECRDVPGYELFQYFDEDGNKHTISSDDVNSYLRDLTGLDFTAKDFRTWAGTVVAVRALQRIGPAEQETEAKKNVVAAVDEVAAHLGNTRAVCRQYYIHPRVLECYQLGTMERLLEQVNEVDGLEPDECIVLTLLEQLESAQRET